MTTKKLINSLTLIAMIVAFELLVILATSLYWEHNAVVHHAALFEASNWGNVSFHWQDDSYAHVPFQDEMWTRIQNNLFQQKLNALDIK
jgi:hypothetical protein